MGDSPRIYLLVVLSLVVTVQCDPCDPGQHRVIKEPRRSSAYVVKDPTFDDKICDKDLPPGWYKFDTGEMPTTCQDQYHCGTDVPLWLQGQLPTDSAEHQMLSCGKLNGNCCQLKFPITVKNCGGFYVYKLKPTVACPIAYCAGDRVPCSPDQWSATGFQPKCTAAYPKVTQSPHLSNPIVQPTTFNFNCDVNFDPARTDVGFQVEWLFDGKPDQKVPKTQLSGTSRQASMDQKYLEGHLGQTLSCRVKSYFQTSPGRMSPGIESNGYWCGIKLSQSSIAVGENEKPRTVKIISTIPIVCDRPNQQTCELEIYLDPNNHDLKQTTSCTQVLKPTDWNTATSTAETSFQVLAERDLKKDGDKNLLLHFDQINSVNVPPLFNNYNIPFLQVRTKDKDSSSCQCWGDPHCSTFDSQLLQHNSAAIYNYYKVGEFQMFQSTTSQFEVQVRTWACGSVSCTCAVAAREGNDVFVVDICHGRYGHTFPHATILDKTQISQGTVVEQNAKGDGWKVFFPSGNSVTISANNYYLNVQVQATEADWGHTQGLCGTFDGQMKNEFTHKDSTVSSFPNAVPHSFVESWRIPPGTSIFDNGFHRDPKYDHSLYFCNCDKTNSQVDCRINGQSPQPAVQPNYHVIAQGQGQGNPNGRRRQTTTTTADDLDYGLPTYTFDYGEKWSAVMPSFPTPSGRTHKDARDLCNGAFNTDPTIQACIRVASMSFQTIIDTCITDIQYTDDVIFVQGAVEAAILTCSEVVLKDLAFYNNATGQPPAFITSDVCLSQCSGNGICNHGNCACNHGYTGVACEINTQTPPPLSGVLSTSKEQSSDLCDISTKPCKTVYVIGDNIMDSPKTKCKVEELSYNGHTFVANGRSHVTAVVYKNRFNVGCKLPSQGTVGGQSVIGYSISLTNDGVHFGSSADVFVTDSTCLNCSVTGGNCNMKDNTCLINGNCFTNGGHNPSNANEICDALKSKTGWTVLPQTTQAPVQQTTARPAAPQGGAVIPRHDVWTLHSTGCRCTNNTMDSHCACCDVGAEQCPSPNFHQCVQTGHLTDCGTPMPSPDFGIDGYTIALDDCVCTKMVGWNCACCQNGGCQCGPSQKNQCVDCDHMDHCGNKPWLFGPPYTVH